MKIKRAMIGLGFWAVGVGCSFADALYTYSGQKYDGANAHAPYTASMSLQGSMTLSAPLPAGLANVPIGPGTPYLISSWSFNDGVNTFTASNSQIAADILSRYPQRFAVSTDSNGNIVAWELFMISPRKPHSVGQQVNNFLSQSGFGDIVADKSDATCSHLAGDVCMQVVATAYTSSSSDGSWTMKIIPPSSPAAVPTLEWPALMVLMGGVLGFAGWQRRKSIRGG